MAEEEEEFVGIDDEEEEEVRGASEEKQVTSGGGGEGSGGGAKFDKELADQVIEEAIALLQEEVINVQNSGFWLTVFSLFYGMVQILGFPMLTVLSLVILLQVGFVVLFVQMHPLLVSAGIISKEFDARWIAEQRTTFSDKEVNSITKGFAALGYKWTKYWENEVLDSESDDAFLFFLGVLVAFTAVNAVMSLPLVLLISGVVITFFPLMVDQFESTEAMVEAIQGVTVNTLGALEESYDSLKASFGE